MAKFRGGDGQDWEIKLTMPVLRRISRDTGLDPFNPDFGGLSIVTLTDAVWIACSDQAKARGLNQDAFFEAVTTPDRAKDLTEAYMLAICEALKIPVPEGDALANPPEGSAENPAPGAGTTS